MRLGYMFFYLFWVLLGRPGILCGFNCKIGRESSFNNDAKYEGVTRDTPLLENSRESLKKLVISWIMHGSRLNLDMMHSWKESSHCRTGGMFLLSVTEFHHKKNYSHSWYLVCLYHMGWLAWIAVMMRLRRRIVWTVNMVQAFSAAMSICRCKHTSHRPAQIMCL